MGIPLRVGTSFIEGVINRLKVLTSCNTVAPYIIPPPPVGISSFKASWPDFKKGTPTIKSERNVAAVPPGSCRACAAAPSPRRRFPPVSRIALKSMVWEGGLCREQLRKIAGN